MKKLLLLGGSRYLLPVIKTAHDLGIYVITCDYLPDNEAHKYSDQYCNISIIEKDMVLEIALENKIDGIMSFACDPGVVTAAYVAEKMKLPYAGSYESVCILQNKTKFRDFLRKNHFMVPKAKGYYFIEDAMQDIEFFNYPVMVKPVDSAGSKGVKRVNFPKELRDSIIYAKSYSHSGEFIIEEYIEKKGDSSDSECFSIDGKMMFVSFNNQKFDDRAENPYVPACFTWPSEISDKSQESITSELQRLADLLKLKTSIYNVETREGKDGKSYIMEVSPRGGGNRLAEMLKYVTGQDLIKAAVLAAIGEKYITFESPRKLYGFWAEVILHSRKDGYFSGINIDSKLEDEFLIEKDIWVKRGQFIRNFTGANETIGTLVFRFNNKVEMNYYIDRIYDFITIEVDTKDEYVK